MDTTRLVNADQQPGNWMSHGRTYSEQRFSPLAQINDTNAAQLGLAWFYDLDTHRGQEATPIVVDGVMYFSTAWSKVQAVDAATGAPLWLFDPKVPPEWDVNSCCDVVNRGVAVWRGKVYVGTLDGRLIALDAGTGRTVWQQMTIDPEIRYTITGAPRVVKDKVIIGNGGGEMGVRGYVSAYDAATGKLVWRFYTVPGDPSKQQENPILKTAAKTWTGQWWKYGGGATVWDSISYDPELDLLYIGTGNGGPWDGKVRSPGGGDDLFTCSIVALRPDSGEYVWHYQEVPGDIWDYDANAAMILADVAIDGQPRKVLMQAAKNGYFYMLDRTNGKLISAKAFTNVTWSKGIDPATGRPNEVREARYSTTGRPALVQPGPLGAHTWQSMAYSPKTGYAYFPVQESGFLYKSAPDFQLKQLGFNAGIDMVAAGLPQDPRVKQAIIDSLTGHLVAWDPVQQKEVWRAPRAGIWNGGVLATQGNLVFEGTGDGELEAYRADTGAKVWSFATQTGVVAAPIAYTANGEEYIALLVGRGGVFPLMTGEIALKKGYTRNVSRVLAFKLGGKALLPQPQEMGQPALNPPPSKASAATVKQGEALFQRYCSSCHGDVGVSGGLVPDLRYSSTLATDQWFRIVLDGLLAPNGMISFKKELRREDAAAIRAYVIARANQAVAEKANPPAAPTAKKQ